MKTKDKLIDRKIENIGRKIRPVLRRGGVVRASLFGSYVRGEQTKGSDIDILIEFKGEKSLLDLVDLEMELAQLLRKKVDLLTYRSIHPLLRNNILSEQKVIL